MPQHQQNRINEKLLAYWESVRGARPMPEERDVDPDALKDIWDSCFLVKSIPHGTGSRGYRYDYLGTALIEAFGDDVTNREISAKLVDPISPPLVKSFTQVIETGKPVEEESEFTNSQNLVIRFRSCMMPLGNAKDGVLYILGGMKWKSF
jgi:hypothetical protein